MNERIRQLADQCREEYPDTEWPDAVRYRFNEAKFAELIILESKCWIHKRIGPKTALDFLEHFGVEE